MAFFQDFPDLENDIIIFQDFPGFPGPVRTLSISRPSQVTTVPCQTVKNGRPGGPSVDIPPEVLEGLRGLGFTWDKIARIFRVSRWTIMRRVRSFDLEHLSLFSTMSDEEIDSISIY